MGEDADRGPFRTAELTPEARRTKEHEASWARVERETERAIALEARRDRRRNLLSVLALAAALLLAVAVVVLAVVVDRGPWPALVCPAIAGVLAALVVVFHRRRRRR